MEYTICTLAERPDLLESIEKLSEASWPRFLSQGILGWDLLYGKFSHFQILFCDRSGDLIAVGHTVPLQWNYTVDDLPNSIEDIIRRADIATFSTTPANTLSALAAMVNADFQGKDMSLAILMEMKSLAARHDCNGLIAPVRPTKKSAYPLIPMDAYVSWIREDGLFFDPWLRTHQRLGAIGLGVAPSTLRVSGSTSDWESWTGDRFPGSGSYVVTGALQPIVIDIEANIGTYDDPNYWMLHPITECKP